MGKWLIYLGFSAFIAVSGGTAVSASELLTTNPRHYSDPSRSMQGGSAAFIDPTKQVRSGSRVIVRDNAALLERWRLNPDLSQACNRRQFRQKRDKYLIGVVDGRTYGAAVGGHASLLDRARMAENQVVYLFRGQDTTDCRVYHRTK